MTRFLVLNDVAATDTAIYAGRGTTSLDSAVLCNMVSSRSWRRPRAHLPPVGTINYRPGVRDTVFGILLSYRDMFAVSTGPHEPKGGTCA